MEKHVWGLTRLTPHIKKKKKKQPTHQNCSGGNVGEELLTSGKMIMLPSFFFHNTKVEIGLQL